MSVVKVNWSGGKDSTASVILHHRKGDKCIIVNYVPMLTPTIPLISKKHYEFIMCAKSVFETWGHEVHILTGKNYCQIFHEKITRGKNKGKIRGYSLGFGFCDFRNLSKIKSLTSFKCDAAYEDIGIACNETKRQGQLNEKKRSILCDVGYTENDAKLLCLEYNLLSPHYATNTRDGCAICPNATVKAFNDWLNDYPEARQILKSLDSEYDIKYKQEKIKDFNGEKISPYRNYKNFTDRIDMT